MTLKPTERKEGENCLYKYNGKCKKCVDYCVVNAISIENGYPFVGMNAGLIVRFLQVYKGII